MLKQLYRKFVIITTALVLLVLIVESALTLSSSRATLNNIADRALERGLGSEIEAPPTIGPIGENAIDDLQSTHMIVVNVLVNDAGEILRSNSGVAIMDEDDLSSIIDRVLAGETEGFMEDEYLRWRSIGYEGNTRIAIVDVEDIENAFFQQARNTMMALALTTMLVAFVSWRLAVWALSPAERSIRQQKQLVADLSHDLKTPLAVILSNMHILKADETLGDEARRWVLGTEEEAHDMQELIGQMLEVARLDEQSSGGNIMREEDIDLSSLVERIVLQFEPLAFERGVSIEESIEEDVRMVGDEQLIDRLVSILIDNACKYAYADTTVTVTLVRDLRGTHLVVSNEGATISPEDLDHIFDRFWRSDKARTRGEQAGFGLGLAIAKGIADAHGGSIQATSDNGLTTFTVSL